MPRTEPCQADLLGSGAFCCVLLWRPRRVGPLGEVACGTWPSSVGGMGWLLAQAWWGAAEVLGSLPAVLDRFVKAVPPATLRWPLAEQLFFSRTRLRKGRGSREHPHRQLVSSDVAEPDDAFGVGGDLGDELARVGG